MKRNEIVSLVASPLDPAKAGTAARIYADPALWPDFENTLYPDADPTDEELETIRRVVSERCGAAALRRQKRLEDFVAARLDRISGGMRDFALAAAPQGGASSPRDANAAEPVTFVFVSDASDVAGSRCAMWRAEMTLPPDAAVDAMLPIAVADGNGEPVSEGVFKVAGVSLPVMRGRAEIPYGMFLSGLKDANVELVDARGVHLPGALALF